MSVAPQRIVQIKGKQNRAPNPEYLPFVQDFVRSGKWSDVGDLQNTGLLSIRDNPVAEIEKRALEKYGRYVTKEEMDDLAKDFAQGGSVQPNKTLTLQDLSAIISALESGNQYG